MARPKRSKTKRSIDKALQWFQSIRSETIVGIIGALFLLAGLVAFVSIMPGDLPKLFSAWQHQSFSICGYLAYIVFAPLFAFGILLLLLARDKVERFPTDRIIGIILLFFMLDGILGWINPKHGGNLGRWFAQIFTYAFGRSGALVMLFAIGGLAIMLALNTSVVGVLQRLWQWISTTIAERRERRRIKSGPRIAVPTSVMPAQEKPAPSKSVQAHTALVKKEEQIEEVIQVRNDIDQVWTLPPFQALLDDHAETALDVSELREKAMLIENTLKSLSIPGTVEEVNPGPTITQYGIKPGYLDRNVSGSDSIRARVKVSSIQNAANDLALALAAKSIRVEAPIPGKSLVGIEIPNDEPVTVGIKSILQSTEMLNAPPLTITLGRDVSGQPVLIDIARLPHLLIAGATGSGKSICINALITCLLCRNTPQELRLLMVDPKRVELTGYNDVPHLLTDVVVEPDRVVGLLAWLSKEMQTRYKRLNEAGVRNIVGYNEKILATDGGKKMPYIVCIIDELGDLMMTSSDQMETLLCRIAQMSRAVGIHLILATQRPSVDVLTGTIKTNFGARLAFAVSSGIDSRVILDTVGAETLLGRGDSLFMHPEKAGLQRIQGCLVTDTEINRITKFWKNQKIALLSNGKSKQTQDQDSDVPLMQQALWPQINTHIDPNRDEMLDRAIEFARKERAVSVSMLQRKLSIGYTRASRIVDQMEEEGAIGPYTVQNKPREVLLPPLGEQEKTPEGDS